MSLDNAPAVREPFMDVMETDTTPPLRCKREPVEPVAQSNDERPEPTEWR